MICLPALPFFRTVFAVRSLHSLEASWLDYVRGETYASCAHCEAGIFPRYIRIPLVGRSVSVAPFLGLLEWLMLIPTAMPLVQQHEPLTIRTGVTSVASQSAGRV